jgi:hypothetical protein
MSLTHEIIYGTLEGVARLIHSGVDVNEVDDYGFTPLIEAAIVNSVDISKLLLQSGAEVDDTDTTGRTALHWAVDNNNLSLCQLLLENKANPNAYTGGAQPILVYPLLRNQQELKQLLYRYGANLDFAQDYINTKLLGHRYQLMGQADIVNAKGDFIELDYEGFFLECTLDIVRNSLERYRNNFAARHLRSYFNYLGTIIESFYVASALLKYQRYNIDINQYAGQIDGLLHRQFILIPVAYEGHAVTFVKYQDLLARCDRGENSAKEGSVVIYHVNRAKRLTTDFLKYFIYKPQSQEFILSGIKNELGLVAVENLPVSSQVIGNCSWANVEASIPTMIFLLMVNEAGKSKISLCKKAAMKFYYDWLEWDKDRALEECIQSFHRASPARKASKAAILGAILFQQCHFRDQKNLRRVEKILSILSIPEYTYVLKSYIDVYAKKRKTEAGNNLMQLLDLYGVKL